MHVAFQLVIYFVLIRTFISCLYVQQVVMLVAIEIDEWFVWLRLLTGRHVYGAMVRGLTLVGIRAWL